LNEVVTDGHPDTFVNDHLRVRLGCVCKLGHATPWPKVAVIAEFLEQSSLAKCKWIEDCGGHLETLVDGEVAELGPPVDVAVTTTLVQVC